MQQPDVNDPAGSAIRPSIGYAYDKGGRQIQTAKSDPSSGFLPPVWKAGTQDDPCHRYKDGRFPLPRKADNVDSSDSNATVDCSGRYFSVEATAYLANGLLGTTTTYRGYSSTDSSDPTYDAPHAANVAATVTRSYTAGGRLKCTDTLAMEVLVFGGSAVRVYEATDFDANTARATATRRQIGTVTGCADGPTDTAKWAISPTGYNIDGSTAWTQTPQQYVEVPDPQDSDHPNYRTSFTYDDLGRQVAVESPDPSNPGTGTVTTHTCYTPRGEVAATVDAGGSTTLFDFYPDHNVRTVWDARAVTSNPTTPCDIDVPTGNTGKVSYTYDGRGNRLSRTAWAEDYQSSNALTEEATDEWEYDLDDRFVRHETPLGNTTLWAYTDTAGRVTSTTVTTGALADVSKRTQTASLAKAGNLYETVYRHLDGSAMRSRMRPSP